MTEPVAITFPRGVASDELLGFCRSLSGLRRPWWRTVLVGQPVIRFEVRATAEGISHLLWSPEGTGDYLLAQLRTAVPGTRSEPITPEVLRPREAIELRVAGPRTQLRVDQLAHSNAAVLATLLPLKPGEVVVIQWLIAPEHHDPRTARWAAAALGFDHSDDAATERAQREKRSEPAFAVAVRLGAEAATTEQARHLVRRVLGAFHLGTTEQASFRRRLLPAWWVRHQLTHASRPFLTWPCFLNAKEISGFLGVPIESPQVPGLVLGAARHLPPPATLPSSGRVVGQATFPGAVRPVAVSPADSLRHLHAIGPTGVGKSTLLAGLALGDIAAGRAVIVIDPKGDLITDIVERIPPHRADDVIVFDPTDAARPVGFNLLEGITEAPELITDHVVGIFHHLYAAFWGPRTDDILRAGVLTLAQEPGMTLAEVPVLLTDPGFRRRLLGKLDDHVLEAFWGWFESLSEAERAQAVGPVLNKLRSFLLRRRLRNVIGQADSTISLERVIENRQVLLVSLAKGVLGEDAASLLGAAVIARLWQATQARAPLPAMQRHPVFCFIDEFQDYLRLPTPLGDVLAQARGYGLGLTLAHQHLGQLPREVRQAVLANARSKVVFQTSAADARILARELGPELAPEDLQSLGAFEAYLAAAADRRVLPPVSIRTRPLGPPTGLADQIRARSRKRYGRPAEEVDAAIRARAERLPNRLVIGTRRQS